VSVLGIELNLLVPEMTKGEGECKKSGAAGAVHGLPFE
jgi:hypothetical protein